MTDKQAGFTLIELMVVIAISAILVAIAIFSYRDHIEKAKRSEARGALLELSEWMERVHSDSGRYDQDASGNTINTAALPFSQAPKPGTQTRKDYDISFSAGPTQDSYTLQATPSGWTDSRCGTLTLAQDGTKGYSGTGDLSLCWPR